MATSPQVQLSPHRVVRFERTQEICAQLVAGDMSPAVEFELRQGLIIVNMPVAEAVAARYRNRGIAPEDLAQVAYLALIKAARNFDAAAGHDFLSYAVPTIRGEVLRHFRDLGWMVRPPRRIQDLQGRVNAADPDLSVRLGRTPSRVEVAAHLNESTRSVDEAWSAAGCFTPTSLDRVVGDGYEPIGELIGQTDCAYSTVEARVVLAPVVRELPARDRRVLKLRYFDGRSQQAIADELGVTQTQVSRLLNRILAQLREALEEPPDSRVVSRSRLHDA